MREQWSGGAERYFTAAGFGGFLLTKDHPGFEGASRVWNGMIDRTPALIAACQNASDVSTAIGFARETGLPLSVRCGGHNVAGTAVADGAVLIDLHLMRGVSVDPGARTALAGGGCLLRDVDIATTADGLACPSGIFSRTGLGGLALGGGYGWRCRKLGLTCDQILGAEMVLADGSVAEASGDQNPDLLWTLRGGGGNFGVVTRFTLRLHPVGPLTVRTATYAGEAAAEGLRVFRALAPELSDDFHLMAGLHYTAAGAPDLALGLTCVCSASDPASAEAARALFDALPAGAATTRTMSYLELQFMGDAGSAAGRRYYTKSGYLSGLGDEAIARLIASAARNPSPTGSIDVEYLRGAVLRSSTAESPFPNREAPFMVTVSGSWDDPGLDQDGIAWAREAVDSLRAWEHPGAYLNYVAQEENPREASAMYGSVIYSRLARIKRRYDPDNVFRSVRGVTPD